MEIQHKAAKTIVIASGVIVSFSVLIGAFSLLRLTPIDKQASAETEANSESLKNSTEIPDEVASDDSIAATAEQNQDSPEKDPTPEKSSIDLTKLPLGTNKFSSSPKVGYVYSCQSSFSGGGAFKTGPWINQSAGTWDLTKKAKVDGSVTWPKADFTDMLSHGLRLFTTNSLPTHVTGKYPISSSDDAYLYDRNPNSIKINNISITLQSDPVLLEQPECVGGEVGVLLSGVAIFNAFDAGGRDAVAMEVQDQCNGHPQSAGLYHYHGPTNCLPDSGPGQHSKLFGYAFDGFGIFGVKGESGIVLSTNDLDACHGHTHEIDWNGSRQVMYHYHLTYDFPYSVSCFRAKKTVTGPVGGAPLTKPAAPVGPAPPGSQDLPSGSQFLPFGPLN